MLLARTTRPSAAAAASAALDTVCAGCWQRLAGGGVRQRSTGKGRGLAQAQSTTSLLWAHQRLQGRSGRGLDLWRNVVRSKSTKSTKSVKSVPDKMKGGQKAKKIEQHDPMKRGSKESTYAYNMRMLRQKNVTGRTAPQISEAVTEASTSAAIEPTAIIPPDASSQLTSISKALPKQSLRRLFATYLSLAKPRLTFLIILTTTAAYSMYPVPTGLEDPDVVFSELAPDAAPTLSTVTLAFLTSGTFLTCASANALNMLMEPKYDAQMSRTRNRPLVRGLLSGRAALLFAIATGTLGTAALYFGVNPTTAFLAASNIFLYAGVYTPLKRIHPLNTWVGAVVGAIPPLMGWTAAAGQCASASGGWDELLFGDHSRGGWALAALLGLWQIPHFAALSFTIRHEYAAAGYRMLCSSNPRLDALQSLVCASLLQACTTQLWVSGVVDSWAFVAMMPVNTWFVWRSWQFLARAGAGASARNLFWASVWHLPIVLVLGMVGKKGLSDRVGAWWSGEEGLADDEEWEEIGEEEATAAVSNEKERSAGAVFAPVSVAAKS